MAAPSTRPFSCSTSSARCLGPIWTSPGPPPSTRSAATTREAAPAPASGCWRNGSGAGRPRCPRRGPGPRVRESVEELLREQGRHRGLTRPAAQLDVAAGQADVDLAADPETPRQVDARLDGEAGVGQVPAGVVRLEVVVVHAVAVPVVIDAVAGAVQEPVGVAGLGDYVARRRVHLGAGGQ